MISSAQNTEPTSDHWRRSKGMLFNVHKELLVFWGKNIKSYIIVAFIWILIENEIVVQMLSWAPRLARHVFIKLCMVVNLKIKQRFSWTPTFVSIKLIYNIVLLTIYSRFTSVLCSSRHTLPSKLRQYITYSVFNKIQLFTTIQRANTVQPNDRVPGNWFKAQADVRKMVLLHCARHLESPKYDSQKKKTGNRHFCFFVCFHQLISFSRALDCVLRASF